MEKIVNRLIDDAVQKVDTYTNNGSTWLIFTDDKRWVIELTKDGTLWYNYNFFNSLFAYASMDVIENQHYITKWVENNVVNKKKPVKNEVKETELHKGNRPLSINDTIQHGVKETLSTEVKPLRVEDTIENGVKHLRHRKGADDSRAENIIQNGVKYTSWHEPLLLGTKVEETIQNGVKVTKRQLIPRNLKAKNVIENGVKETKIGSIYPQRYVEKIMRNGVKNTQTRLTDEELEVEYTIQNGVKDTRSYSDRDKKTVGDIIQSGVKEVHPMDEWVNSEKIVDKTIQNGVKETHRDAERHPTTVKDTIQNGVKVTYSDKIPHEYDWTDQFDVKEVIETGVKHTEKSLQIDGSCVIEDVIKEGVKHTEYGDWEDGDERLDDIIKNGVKETLNETHHRRREVVQTVKNGIKETCAQIPSIDAVVERVVEEGIKETHDDVYHHNGRVEGVIKNGIKEVQPLPAQDGNMDYSNYYYRQGDRTKPHTQYVNDVIENSIKETIL